MSVVSKPCALLEQHLKPLEKYLKMGGSDVTDICINRPQEVCVESKTKGWKIYPDKEITTERLRMLFEVLATTNQQKFNEEYPILATKIPGYNFRCHVLNSTITEDGISVSIRKCTASKYPLESYFPEDEEDDDEIDVSETDDPHEQVVAHVRELLTRKRKAEALKALMVEGGAVIVCGGTSTGKTSLVNSMLEYIPENERIITVEDTHELQVTQKNRVHIIKSKSGSDIGKLSYTEVIDSANRMRPDRVFFGELDVPNTMAFLRSINTGHRGSMGTLHANNAQAVIEALVMNMQLAGFDTSEDKIERYIKSKITAIVLAKCKIKEGKRRFTAKVVLPK